MTNFQDFLSLFDTFKPFRSKIDAFSLLEPFLDRSQSPKGFKLFFDTKIHFHLQFHEFFALWEHSEAFTETLSPFFSKIVAFDTFHHVESDRLRDRTFESRLGLFLEVSGRFQTLLSQKFDSCMIIEHSQGLQRPFSSFSKASKSKSLLFKQNSRSGSFCLHLLS